jgi:hypothetical protein
MGQTSVPETLVIHQKLTPGYNPKTFKQHYDHGGSLQLHTEQDLLSNDQNIWQIFATCGYLPRRGNGALVAFTCTFGKCDTYHQFFFTYQVEA